jgi:hypothetical protein
MRTIDVIIPSRERPELAIRCAHSALDTCDEIERVKVYIGIDIDDPKIEEYVDRCEENAIELLVSPTSGSAPQCVDWMWRQTGGEIIVLGTDDVIFRTKGWDTFLYKLFERQPYIVVSPNDGRKRRKLEQPIVSRKWCELTGMLFPPFHHFCADEWIQRIADKSGLLAYCMDITMEHMHPKFGKAQWDDVYMRKRGEEGAKKQVIDKEMLVQEEAHIQELAEKLAFAASEYEASRAA